MKPCRLHVEDEGSGTPVLLLHGFTGSTETLAATAEALRARHRTLRVDLPGHGRADAPADVAAYTLEATCDALEATLDAAGCPDAHVLGYSMGGRVALGLAVRRPARVRSLVLVGASAGLADPAARAARVAADEELARGLERDGIAPFVERWMALPLFASQTRLGPDFLADARRQRLANDPAALARSLRGVGTGAQPPLQAALPGLERPVLLVAGGEDAKFRALAADLHARIPRSELAVLESAGHAAHLESPAAFAAATLDFLRRVDATRAPSTHPIPRYRSAHP